MTYSKKKVGFYTHVGKILYLFSSTEAGTDPLSWGLLLWSSLLLFLYHVLRLHNPWVKTPHRRASSKRCCSQRALKSIQLIKLISQGWWSRGNLHSSNESGAWSKRISAEALWGDFCRPRLFLLKLTFFVFLKSCSTCIRVFYPLFLLPWALDLFHSSAEGVLNKQHPNYFSVPTTLQAKRTFSQLRQNLEEKFNWSWVHLRYNWNLLVWK